MCVRVDTFDIFDIGICTKGVLFLARSPDCTDLWHRGTPCSVGEIGRISRDT
jgi:hypothetical protein